MRTILTTSEKDLRDTPKGGELIEVLKDFPQFIKDNQINIPTNIKFDHPNIVALDFNKILKHQRLNGVERVIIKLD